MLNTGVHFTFKSHNSPPLVDQIDASEVVIDNKFVTATFDSFGRLKQYYDKRVDRQVIPEGSLGNVFKYYEDIPVYWDAWDVEVYHLEKGWEADLGTMTVEEEGEARVVLLCQHKISSTSTLVQRIIITSESPMIEFDTRVNWNENRKMLKVEFTVDVSNDVATYECQYGYVQRPTHYNTSWDMAKFEVCGHKFVDYSEFGYGVAIINDW